MSFEVVDSIKKRDQIIQEFLKNRDILKQRILNEKIGKQEFQRDVAQELFKPVTETFTEVQKKTDEKQNKMIEKLQEGQNQLALSQNKIVHAIRDAGPSGVEGDVKYLFPAQPLMADLNAGIDLNIITNKKYGEFKPPNELINLTRDELNQYQQSIAANNKLLGNKKSKAKGVDKEEIDKVLDEFKKYNKIVKAMKEHHDILPKPTSGKGLTTKNSYKLNKDSMFGRLHIDPQSLMNLKLDVYRDNKKIFTKKVDTDFIDLLTKRYNKKRKYSKDAIDTFNKLIEFAGLPINKRHQKYGACTGNIQYYKSPQELAKRLQLVIASKEAGNESIELDNEIVDILTKLYNDEAITKVQYKQLYNSCF